jgi:CHAT domain-containing protein/Tfp pilus assembly protein PilF
MKWAVVLLAVTTSCRPQPKVLQEQRYRNAVLTFRHGELTQALDQARSESRRAIPDSEYYWKFRLLEAEVLRYQGNPSAAAAILARSIPDRPEFMNVEARRKMLLSSLPTNQPKEEKRKLIDEAFRQAEILGDTDLLLDVEILKGYHLSADDPEQARWIFLGSRERAVGVKDAFHEAVALNDLGMLSIQKSRFDEAIHWFEQALDPAKRSAARPLISTALYNLAICYNQLGAYDEAEERLRQALGWFGSGEVKAVRRDLLATMAKTYEFGGNELKAVEYYRQALDIAQQMQGSGKVRSRLTDNLCGALAAVGDWGAAGQANKEEMALAADARAKGYARLNSAAIAAGQGHFEQAVSDYQAAIETAADEPAVLWESYAGLGRAYSRLGKHALAGRHFEKALRLIEENRVGLSRDEYKISFLARLISFYQDYVESVMRTGAYEKALEVADSSRARILVEKLALDKVPHRNGGAAYQAYARKSNLVLVSYWLAPKQSYAWVISPKRIQWFPLPPAGEIGRLVEQYQAFIEKSVRDPLAVENPAGRRLYELLIAPAAALIPPGTRVVLMPDGPLHRLNFETLPVYGNKPRYWIEDVTVSIASSLSILMMSPSARQRRSRSLLLMGGALYAGTAYEPLRYSSLEIEKIRRRFDSSEKTVLTGAAANPAAYRDADPERFSIIHFSAHGEANRQSPLDSAIILSAKDGLFKLYAHDIMRTPLQADLVTISACRSAGSRAYAGEGMVGLAWAFLRSGARNTIAGLWDVDDTSTPGMMDTVYGSIEAGKSPVEALRLAKLAMVHSADAYRKPYYWGPFQIYGR